MDILLRLVVVCAEVFHFIQDARGLLEHDTKHRRDYRCEDGGAEADVLIVNIVKTPPRDDDHNPHHQQRNEEDDWVGDEIANPLAFSVVVDGVRHLHVAVAVAREPHR